MANSVTEAGHGRNAGRPQDIPAAGWKDVLLRTYREFGDDRVTLIAAAVTYYLLLSLFPTLTAFVSIYGLFADRTTVGEHINMLSSVVPQGGMTIINEQLTALTSTGDTTLGFALLISIAIALWSSSSGVKTMFEAMNVAYGEREKRNFLTLNATALTFTLAGLVGGIVMIGAAIVIPAVLEFVGLGSGLEWLLRIGSYALLAIALMTGLAALYRFGPSRHQAKWRWVSPGAIVATVLILVVSLLFSWYAGNFANYDKTYGSLGGLIALLTWMWISVTAVIIGAELNSEAERQTRQDTTEGSDQPMGQRAATVADTIGARADQEHGQDDALAGQSAEWVAGFMAAQERFRPRRQPSYGAMAVAIAASAALGYARRRTRRR